MVSLPIDDVMPDVLRLLARETRLVLAAPPGAGKTTRVPLKLLAQPWLDGRRILLLEPRRIAARMAADRLAAQLGESTGQTIGLSTRVDRKVSANTRIEVLTDGLFTKRILADPELVEIGAVIFDEFHERSLNIDLGLALALDAQSAFRPDLRLILMSATLNTARASKVFGAPVIESEGRIFPIQTIYAGRPDNRLEEHAARIIRRALSEQKGSILVFLPGQGEIRRTTELLKDLPADIIVAPLFGAMTPADQDLAVAPAQPGKRKIVLATDIAETSLTIEGVNTVIDAGLARIAEYAPGAGAPTLVTRRAARANVDQRRGRAGRLGPGACYRLWDEEATKGLPAEPGPEILQTDLSGLLLALSEWGETDPRRLTWLDPPPIGRLEAARVELREIGALDEACAVTEMGRRIAALPLAPRLASMITAASLPDERALAAEIAALISERGLGGESLDIRDRLVHFRRDRSPRAKAMRQQVSRWASGSTADIDKAGRVIARAFPKLIALKTSSGRFLTASGRLATTEVSAPLSNATWIAIADLTGAAKQARILAAAPLAESDALAFGGMTVEDLAEFDSERRAFRAKRVKRVGQIVLSETPLQAPSGEIARKALLEAIARRGFELLEHAHAIREYQARIAIAAPLLNDAAPDFSDAALIARGADWLAPLFGDPPTLERATSGLIRRSLTALLDWETARAIDTLAPLHIETLNGHTFAIDYLANGGPLIEARAQEFFGLAEHPAILNGALPLTVSLLSPARRQIALTRDLPSFWRGGYSDMAKDMRAQYPKHDWPDDPAKADAHAGITKARLKRGP